MCVELCIGCMKKKAERVGFSWAAFVLNCSGWWLRSLKAEFDIVNYVLMCLLCQF